MKTAAITSLFTLAAAAAQAGGFTLSSADIAPGATIDNHFVFKGFGCSGDNVSPALKWSGAPAGTQGFALLVHDPDAPTGGAGWWHWVVYDIPATASGIEQGAGTADGAKLPAGSRQATTDFGAPGWGGPCPPVGHGKHHYNFRLYALKVAKLDVAAGASAALVGYMVNANAIGQASFTGLYGR
jgi:Raf kinase inhibitor-like YbhB/YbcL family protein